MAKSLLFRNARLIFPDRIEPAGDLRVTDGKISALAPSLSPDPGEEVIDLGGRYLSPGFIDIHIHGAVGHDTMDATPEAYEAILNFHATGGTTALLLTTVTETLPNILRVMETAEAFRKKEPTGARLLGIHLEGPFFSKEKPGAHQIPLIRNPTPDFYEPLLAYATGEEPLLRQMTLAPELPGALELIDRLRTLGVRVSGGHSDAWDDEACAAFAQGMEGVTHTFNCMSSARRKGAYRVAGLLEFALGEPGILCEVIADGHHVSPTLLRMLCAAKGYEGVVLVTDASAGAGLPVGTTFGLGEVQCTVGEGICLTSDGKALAGSAATMIQLVRTMVQQANIPLARAVAMATLIPARALGLTTRGVLANGLEADLVVLNDALEVEATYLAGRAVYTR